MELGIIRHTSLALECGNQLKTSSPHYLLPMVPTSRCQLGPPMIEMAFTFHVPAYLVSVIASGANVSLRVAELVLLVVPVQPHLEPFVNIQPGLLLSDPLLRQPGDCAAHDAQQHRLDEAVCDVVPLWRVELNPHAQLRISHSCCCCVVGEIGGVTCYNGIVRANRFTLLPSYLRCCMIDTSTKLLNFGVRPFAHETKTAVRAKSSAVRLNASYPAKNINLTS